MKNPPKIVQKINTALPLPSLPGILLAVVRICNREDCTTAEIAATVSMDPGFTIKLLRIDHQDSVGPESTLKTLERTISRLGAETVKSLALFAFTNPLSNPMLAETESSFWQYWIHSLRCGTIARNLSRRLQPDSAEDAYIAGVLHDIGKLVLWNNFKKDYESVFKKTFKRDNILLTEHDMIGTNHCEAGWNLVRTTAAHPFVTDAVFYHHWPAREVAKALPVVKIVYAANAMSHRLETAARLELMRELEIGLSSSQLDLLLKESEQQLAERLAEIGLDPNRQELARGGPQEAGSVSLLPLLGEFRNVCTQHLAFSGIGTDDKPPAALRKLISSLKLIFDIRSALLFRYDAAKALLRGTPAAMSPGDTFIHQVRLPVATGGSLPALAVNRRKIVDSFGYLTNETASIADDELIRLLGTEGMLCIPVFRHRQPAGVICAGIDEPQFPLLWEQLRQVEQFAVQTAPMLDAAARASDGAVESAAPTAEVGSEVIRRVVHEVNNPLGIVKNYLNVLSSKIGEQPDVRNEIDMIREEIERIPGIIAQLSQSHLRADREEERLDINTIIEDLARLLKTSVLQQSGIALHFFPDVRLPTFLGNRGSLVQVFTNLLKNAVEAMPGGGNIYIATAFEPGEASTSEGDLVITISDDGPGIPDEVISRLFEPVASSKGPEHFGLGLSICKEIVRRYDGTITCESRRKEGTTFRITFPASADATKPSAETTP